VVADALMSELDDAQPSRLPSVCVGQVAEPDSLYWLALELYRLEHGNCWYGRAPTAVMMNQVVDWWNGRNGA
jgi:hypothetical protein